MPPKKTKADTKKTKVKVAKKNEHDKPIEPKSHVVTSENFPGKDRKDKKDKPKKRSGHPSIYVPVDKRKMCGAQTKKIGMCEKCKYRPVPDENNYYAPHKGKCVKCGGKMICISFALKPNGRCRLHGGNLKKGILSNRGFKNGMVSKEGYSKYLPDKLASLYDEIQKEKDRLSVQKELDVLDVFLRDLLPRMQGSELWDKADTILTRMERGSAYLDESDKWEEGKDLIETSVARLRKLIRAGHNDADLRTEVRQIIEDKSRIASREARRQLEQRMHLSIEEGTALLAGMAKLCIDGADKIPGQLGLMLQLIKSDEVITPGMVMDKSLECVSNFKKQMVNGLQALMNVRHTSLEDKSQEDVEIESVEVEQTTNGS